jgi:hypothetical protein
MKPTPLLTLALTLAMSHTVQAQPYQCTFQSGAVAQTRFPCEPAMVEKFGKRLLQLYPEVEKINTSPDYIMNLYTFAMTSCTGQFATMTPDEIGKNSEPFFPKEMMAAMVKAGREILCPEPRQVGPK